MSELNIRAAAQNTRAATFDKETKIVQFYFCTYGVKNDYGEIFLNGCLRANIAKPISEIKHFKNHEQEKPPGVVLEIGEDEFGAWARCELLKTRSGEETYEEYLKQQITQHSMGFHYKQDGYKFDKGLDAIIITDFELREVSSLNGWGSDKRTKTINLNGENFDRSEFINSIKGEQKPFINFDRIIDNFNF